MTLAFIERPEFKRGRVAELLVSTWLQQRGWFVIPSYDYAGLTHDKPPRLQGIRQAFPIPDLDICRGGDRRWVEVKAKGSAAMYWKRGVYQHGVHNYEHYLRVEKETGSKTWLAVLELDDIDTPDKRGVAGQLLMQTFERLGEPQRGPLDGKPAAFWPRDSFLPAYRFTNIRTALEGGV